MNISFIVDTLRPYLARIEAEIQRKLLPKPNGKGVSYVARFDVSERLRGDAASTQSAIASAVQNGVCTRNEGRALLGLNRGPDSLDIFTAQVNLTAVENLSKPAESLPNAA